MQTFSGDRVRAAMRIVAFDGPPEVSHLAKDRMTGRGDPIMTATILETALPDAGVDHKLPQADLVTLALGAVEAPAVAERSHVDPTWREKLDRVMQRAHDLGMSLRDIGKAAELSHTGVGKRIAELDQV